MSKTISQREALRLRKRVAALEEIEQRRANSWSSDYPGGVHFWTIKMTAETKAAVNTARKLGHAVVVTTDGEHMRLYAVQP